MKHGALFRMIRLEKRETIDSVSRKSGVSKGVISKFENGGNITLKSLVSILKSLNHKVWFN